MKVYPCSAVVYVLFVLIIVFSPGCNPPSGIVISSKTPVTIVKPANPTPPEMRAITELTNYLFKITGASFDVIEEQMVSAALPTIYVGPTDFAKKHGIETDKLDKEESIVCTIGSSLVIAGGRPRGTLYGVYRFLENQCGVRWYTPWCELVPSQPRLVINLPQTRHKPTFNMRDAYYWGMSPGNGKAGDEGYEWWLARNQINGPAVGEGVWFKTKYQESPSREDAGGGWVMAGPSGHSFWHYFPPSKYYTNHPDFYSMRNGKRVNHTDAEFGVSGDHLCLSNKELQELYKEKIRDIFRAIPSGDTAGIGINDGGNWTVCDCPDCTAFVKERGNGADLLMNFITPIADALQKDFPGKTINSLVAYGPTKAAPISVKVPDNVIPFIGTLPLADMVYFPDMTNTFWYKEFASWCSVAKGHVWVWDKYNNAFFNFAFLRPEWWQIEENVKLFKKMGVSGDFTEDEVASACSVLAEFYEMRPWIHAKLTENADLNVDDLMRDFMHGYFGRAGDPLFEYLMMQKTCRSLWPWRMVDYEYIHKAQTLFDQAEAAVEDNAVLTARVRDARIQLDFVTLVWRNRAIREYLMQGGKIESYPYQKAMILNRLLNALTNTSHPLWQQGGWIWQENRKEPMKEFARNYANLLAKENEYSPLPKELQALPPGDVIEIPIAVNDSQRMALTNDAEAALGVAYRISVPSSRLPVCPSVQTAEGAPAAVKLDKNSIKGTGYSCFKADRSFTMGDASSYGKMSGIYVSGMGEPTAWLHTLYDPNNRTQRWDFYVSAKVVPQDKNGEPWVEIYLDRYFIVKLSTPQNQP